MSVLVKGWEKPIGCRSCNFVTLHSADIDGMSTLFMACQLTHEPIFKTDYAVFMPEYKIGENCPLVEVPTPHGRLIDEDSIPVCMTLEEEAKMVAVIEAEE